MHKQMQIYFIVAPVFLQESEFDHLHQETSRSAP